MKIKRTLSVILSLLTITFMATGFSANAGFGINPNEATYTLNQLMDMTDEEFLSLENSLIPGGAQGVYDYVEKHSRGDYLITIKSPYYNKIGGYFTLDTLEDFYYKPNYTEKLINELLADSTYEYSATSPIDLISSTEKPYYNWYYSVRIPELGDETKGIENGLLEATDENIMKAAKVLYCLKQACPNFGWSSGIPILSGVNTDVVTGDVNLDEEVDLYDVIWIASDLVDIFKLTEGQQKVGDVNEDSVCDLYDAIEIAETIMEK